MPKPALAIVGPTGVGKTTVAVQLCHHTGGEIVSVDSRQVYRGLEICSNVPTVEELEGVRCHLVSCLDVGRRVDAASYLAMARPIIEGLVDQGRLAVLTAGTGLYLRALLEGQDLGGHPADPALRLELEAEAAQELAALHRRLALIEPEVASRVDARNPVRVVRATELALRRQRGDQAVSLGTTPLPATRVGLTAPRNRLYEWIQARVDRMLAREWEREIEGLLDSGKPISPNVLSGIGVREMVALVRGQAPRKGMAEVILKRTRNYAKRQLTWFRADPEVRWLDVTQYSGSDMVEAILELSAAT